MSDGVKIEIYRNQSLVELTKKLSDPENRVGAGSAAAAAAAVAAGVLALAAERLAAKTECKNEKMDWYLRNTEILRAYMVNLVDEDVNCHGPLRLALKEGDERRIEAARQTAVSICLEIVNMMGKCLEMAEGMLPAADGETSSLLLESADLAFGASLAAGRHVLFMSGLSQDDTYRFVMKRENELTMQVQREVYNRITVAEAKLELAL